MAIVPSTKYSGQIDTSDPTGYPQGKAQNVSTAGDGTGTPLEQDWVNDFFGFVQALLDSAGITASGTPDKVGASDLLDALDQRLGTSASVKTELYNVMGYTWDNSGTDEQLVNRTLNTLDFTPEHTDLWGMSWANDGLELFLSTTSVVHRWTTTTPYDLPSLSHNATTYTVSGTGAFMRNDGLKLYVLDSGNDYIEEYDVSPAYDLGGVTLNGNSPTYTSESGIMQGFVITDDGEKVFMASGADVWRYTMSTAWDITTMAFDTGQDLDTIGAGYATILDISPDGTRIITGGTAGGGMIRQYTLTTALDLTTAVLDGVIALEEVTMRAINWAGDGGRAHFGGLEQDVIQEIIACQRYL